MSDRDLLVQNFQRAARALATEGLSSLSPEQAVLADAAMRNGAELVFLYATSSGTLVGPLPPSGNSQSDL